MDEREIYISALEMPSAKERAAFLDGACQGDGATRRRLDALFREHDELGSFLESPPAALVTRPDPTVVHAPRQGVGAVLGPYKLLEPIGEGGMGVVYMAEQTHPVQRKVALKVIKPGMDSRQVIARFEVERQALSMMDHPNIARVLDAGTTEAGRPYFVMELVHGVPITRYCDDHCLTPRQRLELFVPVCQAIQHAHQKGIIHRDIKPSNVMVTLYDGKPVPKVIDFGVAKAIEQQLTERTLFTQYGTLVGTLEYMSPEQAELSALGVDTRSDIYSLGVLLYELLTGNTPLSHKRVKDAAYAEILRMIREEEPPKPSTRLSGLGEALESISAQRHMEPAKLSKLLRGELDWIVMKTLEKDRNRRYATANGFAADVERYLNDEAVQACPPSTSYRFCKFARRNRRVLATAGLVSVALVAAVVGLAVSNTLIRREMGRTDQHRAQAEYQSARADIQRARVGERAKALEWQDYISRVNLAYRECLANNVARALDLLDGCPEDLRGWEWSYVSRQCHLDLQTFREPGTAVNAVTFSPDGRHLALASGSLSEMSGGSGDLVVRDVATGREVFAHRGLPGGIRAVAFSPDGRWIATGHAATLTLWNATTGQERFHKTDPRSFALLSLAYHPDGRRIIAGYGMFDKYGFADSGYAKVMDATTGDELGDRLPGLGSGVWGVAFSPDGEHVALATGPKVEVWDLTHRKLLRTLLAHTGYGTYTVAFSPDGRYLASGGWDKTIRLWDRANGSEVRTFSGHEGRVFGLAFHPDGQRIVSASEDRSLKLWSVDSDRELATLHGHQRSVHCVAFSPDGTQLASGSSDRTLKLWSATPDLQLTIRGPRGHVRGVAFSPDGRSVASGWDGGNLELCDPATGEQLRSFDRQSTLGALAFSPDGRRLAAAALNPKVIVWDTTTGRKLLTLMGTSDEVIRPGVAFSPDGRYLALADNDRSVKVWEAATGEKLHTLHGHSAAACAVAFSPDSRTLASAGDDRTVKLWDTATGQELLTLRGHTAPVSSVAFSPDGRWLASAGGNSPFFQALDADAAQHGGPLVAAADSQHFGEVKVWDRRTGRELHQLRGHTDAVTGVAFSPDGRRLVTASDDLTIKLWDIATGHEVFTLRAHTAAVLSVAFSPDGRRIVSGSSDWTTKVWDLDASPSEVLSCREAMAQVASGESFLEMGRWDEAAAALTRALRLKLDNPRLRLARGRAFDRLGQSQRAEAEYSRAVELAPTNANTHNNVAWVLATHSDPRLRDPGRAVALAKKAVELAPTAPEYQDTLGVAHYRAGDWHGAIEALTKSDERPPDKRPGFNAFFLAMAHWKLGDRSQARTSFDKAVRWMQEYKPADEDLARFRAEAADLLELDKQKD